MSLKIEYDSKPACQYKNHDLYKYINGSRGRKLRHKAERYIRHRWGEERLKELRAAASNATAS